MRVVFVEPLKDIWFVMGEYLPPPYGIIQLAAYHTQIQNQNKNTLNVSDQSFPQTNTTTIYSVLPYSIRCTKNP